MPDPASQNQPEKLDLRSMDIAEARRQELLRLFPEIRTEGGTLDIERLKLALGEAVDVGRERYGMNWPGKADCFKTIQSPSMGTLRPCPEESVNWDTTEHLIIEGDNLEVLKLLQKSYLGKVKMIYIDPPYNTGSDFIYPDNYAESLETYLEYTGQVDTEGRRFGTNPDSEGRFHSKWLNMMYPRLYLARNLLRDDGVMMISIDDNELQNLRRVCDEVFGEDAFACQIAVVNNLKGRNDKKYSATCHEYLVVYCMPGFVMGGLPLTEEQRAAFDKTDAKGQKYTLRDLRKRGSGDRREDRPNMWFEVYFNPIRKTLSLERQSPEDVAIRPLRGDGSDGRWRWGRERVAANLENLEASKSDRTGKWGMQYRVFLNAPAAALLDDEDDEESNPAERTSKTKSFWTGPELSTDVAKRSFKELIPEVSYDYPKSVEFLKKCLHLGAGRDGLVLDFFAGSGTLAQAVLEQNAEDGAVRRFALVQLPEPIEYKQFDTIASVTKERTRRVIKKLNDEDAGTLASTAKGKENRGFRVFALSQSNFTTWDAGAPQDGKALQSQMALHIEHIRSERTEADLLFELLLKSGFPLTTPVEMLTFADKKVYSVAGGALMLCLERPLTMEVIRAIADKKPERVVCLDAGFVGNDQLKTNAVQIFKTKGIGSFKTV